MSARVLQPRARRVFCRVRVVSGGEASFSLSGFLRWLCSERFDLLAQCPDEAGEFACDSDDDLVAIQTARRERR